MICENLLVLNLSQDHCFAYNVIHISVLLVWPDGVIVF